MNLGSTVVLGLFPGAGEVARPARDGCRHPEGLAIQLHEHRAQAEFFIRDVFAVSYGARLGQLMPVIVAERDPEGGILAACGLRAAAGAALFLERYLASPIEALIAARCGAPAARARVVEVGNLALRPPFSARRLIGSLTRFLLAGETEWVAFTAVPTLRNAFTRLAIPSLALGQARAGVLPPEERAAWGNYYDTAPEVLAVRVRDAARALLSRPLV
jgi:hypothetical protein